MSKLTYLELLAENIKEHIGDKISKDMLLEAMVNPLHLSTASLYGYMNYSALGKQVKQTSTDNISKSNKSKSDFFISSGKDVKGKLSSLQWAKGLEPIADFADDIMNSIFPSFASSSLADASFAKAFLNHYQEYKNEKYIDLEEENNDFISFESLKSKLTQFFAYDPLIKEQIMGSKNVVFPFSSLGKYYWWNGKNGKSINEQIEKTMEELIGKIQQSNSSNPNNVLVSYLICSSLVRSKNIYSSADMSSIFFNSPKYEDSDISAIGSNGVVEYYNFGSNLFEKSEDLIPKNFVIPSTIIDFCGQTIVQDFKKAGLSDTTGLPIDNLKKWFSYVFTGSVNSDKTFDVDVQELLKKHAALFKNNGYKFNENSSGKSIKLYFPINNEDPFEDVQELLNSEFAKKLYRSVSLNKTNISYLRKLEKKAADSILKPDQIFQYSEPSKIKSFNQKLNNVEISTFGQVSDLTPATLEVIELWIKLLRIPRFYKQTELNFEKEFNF